MSLSIEQKELVELHMNLVPYVIKKYITRVDDIDMRYEDLMQQGNFALCKAAAKYDKSTKFSTFAVTVIRNELKSYCAKSCKKIKTESIDTLDFIDSEKKKSQAIDDVIMNKENIQMLRKIRKKYSGSTLKGLKAIELRMLGFAGKDIAKFYGVKPNHVSAWIAMAKKSLLKDKHFICSFYCN